MSEKSIKSASENSSACYIRLNVKDKPGVLGNIAAVFSMM